MTGKRQRWFAVRLLSESAIPQDLAAEPLFEDSLVVLRATDEIEAQQLGKKHGLAAQHEYENEAGERVRWTFREVLDVQELADEEISDGTEVYQRLLGPRELHFVRQVLSARDEEPSAV
jgi:hypothetical protein